MYQLRAIERFKLKSISAKIRNISVIWLTSNFSVIASFLNYFQHELIHGGQLKSGNWCINPGRVDQTRPIRHRSQRTLDDVWLMSFGISSLNSSCPRQSERNGPWGFSMNNLAIGLRQRDKWIISAVLFRSAFTRIQGYDIWGTEQNWIFISSLYICKTLKNSRNAPHLKVGVRGS